jgi:hypothetical protein
MEVFDMLVTTEIDLLVSQVIHHKEALQDSIIPFASIELKDMYGNCAIQIDELRQGMITKKMNGYLNWHG